MKFSEIVDLYIDWSYGCDETISQSDIMCECFAAGFEYDDVVKAGDAEGKKRFGKKKKKGFTIKPFRSIIKI